MANTRRAHDEEAWTNAKKTCRLNARQTEMARALGMNPRKLPGLRPSPQQRWKLPVGEFIEECYRKRFSRSVTLRVECPGQTVGDVNRRRARTIGSVDLERPSRLVHLTNDRASHLKRRSGCCKVEGIGSNSSDAQRYRNTAVAGARGSV